MKHVGARSSAKDIVSQEQLAALLPLAGGTMTGPINEATIARFNLTGSTVNAASVSANTIQVDAAGGSSITSFGPAPDSGVRRCVILGFDGISVVHSSSLIIPGGQNIAGKAGDAIEIVSQNTTTWKVLDYVKADGTPLVTPSDPNKVDKVSGKQLSTEDFTTELKAKLAGLDPNHFRGVFATGAALAAAVPTANDGDFANVDPGTGTNVRQWLWDSNDSKWVDNGPTASLTAAQVKTLYEANPDTNGYSDAEKSKLGLIAPGATANATDAQLRDRATHTGTQAQSTITGLVADLAGKASAASPTITGTSNMRGSIELGRIDAASSTVIDFHSGATVTDYDSRIIATGGNGTIGSGSLQYIAAQHTFSGPAGFTGAASFTGAVDITTNGGSSLSVANYSDSALSEILLAKARGTLAAPTPIMANDRLGQFTFRGRTTTAAFNNSAALVVYAAEDFSASAAGTYLTLENAAAGGTARSLALTINESNNILIGVARSGATGAKLDVGGNIRASGNVQVGGTAILDGASGASKVLSYRTAGLSRWNIVSGAEAESGSNAGSTFAVVRYSDAGGYLSTPLSIDRQSGQTTLAILLVNGAARANGPVSIGIYTLATLPSAPAYSGYYITVTNATVAPAGRKLCYSDGANWNIANTNTPVS